VEKWELAYKDYQNGMKYKEIAAKYDVSINTVKSWKSRKWGAPPEKKVAHKTQKVAHKTEAQPVIENDELTEQQKLFCLYYLQCFNATKAYQKAYQCDYKTANASSYRMLVNLGIKKELQRLKAELQQDILVDAKDVVKEYVKQAFADITDFTEFGNDEYPFLDLNGHEVLDEETGEVKTYKVSYVALKNSDEVDGSLIQEVKKGKDGVSVKLYDKQKAMNELMKYLDKETDSSGNEAVDWKQAVINAANKRAVDDHE
jgi:phage terminase small subunit